MEDLCKLLRMLMDNIPAVLLVMEFSCAHRCLKDADHPLTLWTHFTLQLLLHAMLFPK